MNETGADQKKQHKKEIMDAWRAEKKERRALRRERRRARPIWQKILSVLWKAAVVLIAAGGIFYFAGGGNLVARWIVDYYTANIYAIEKMDTEEIRSGCIIDQDAADRVAAMPGYGQEDTWAIYIYMVGSDLESMNENDLSEMVNVISQEAAEEHDAAGADRNRRYIDAYLTALDQADMEMPSPMYVANRPEQASSVPVTTEVVKADSDGAAYMDIKEILHADLSDKVDIVIQTGGAKRWSSPIINPNRIQRFHVSNHALVEEENMPTESMATPEALADFLSYCEENHNADHKMVIFWNHGGASRGYGFDEIFDQQLSLKDMKKALKKVYGSNPKEAPFELIGFDACLMTAAESLDTFENYGKYFVGSEETEPGYGWYYTKWLNKLSENLSMNGAQLGMNIVDDYADFYEALDTKVSLIVGKSSVGLYVLDLKEAGKVYDEYKELVKQVLTDTQTDPEALTDLSRAAHESIHYCTPMTELFNTVDLGIMMDNLSSRYPKQAEEIKNTISNAVLYGRAQNNMVGSQGISVYFPDSITQRRSLIWMMDYINRITDDDAIKALYFYKAAGCLTDDMREALSVKLGITELENIDTEALKEVQQSEPEITGEGSFTLTIPENALKYTEDYRFALGFYGSDKEILNYGEACGPVALAEGGKLSSEFDGKWPCIGGQPLACEIIQQHEGIITYRSSILMNGKAAYLIYAYDSSDGEFDILGAYLKSDQIDGDYVARNVSDLTLGVKITPVYVSSSKDEGETEKYGKAVRYTERTRISYDKLPDGNYCSVVLFTDVRGDEFNSQVVEFNENNGKITGTALSTKAVYLED